MPVRLNEAPAGFYDVSSGARWAEGEEIFRVYKGKEFRARAQRGQWTLLNTGARCGSLKALSDATVGHENAWTDWKFLDDAGRPRIVSDRRDQSTIRGRRNPTIDELVNRIDC